jgi:hypothetical protein
MIKGKRVDETHYVDDSKLKLVVAGGFEPPTKTDLIIYLH